MKRIVALIIAVTMVLAMVACGNGGNADGTVTLTWLVPGNEQTDMQLVMDEVNKILEPAIGAKLDLKFIPQSAYAEKMKMNMASGSKFDLCFASNWLNNYEAAAKDGGLYDITDLIDDELNDLIEKKYWDDIKIDGKIYGVPNQQVMFSQLAVAVKTDLVEKYNIDLSNVNKIDDIEPILALLKEKEPDLYTFNCRWSIYPWVYDSVAEVGGYTGVGRLRNSNEAIWFYEHPDVQHAISQLRSWYQKGYIRADYATTNGDSNLSDIEQGRYAVMVDGWKPGVDILQSMAGSKIRYTYKPITQPYFSGADSTMIAVGAGSKNPEKAVEFIKFINSNVEAYNLICYGIEGKHYTKNAEGKMILPDTSGYMPQGDWKFGNQFNAYLTDGLPDDIWEETERLNGESKTDIVFSVDKDPIKNELAQVSSVFDEYKDFITVKDYDTFVANRQKALQEAGQQKVFDELAKQLKENAVIPEQ